MLFLCLLPEFRFIVMWGKNVTIETYLVLWLRLSVYQYFNLLALEFYI